MSVPEQHKRNSSRRLVGSVAAKNDFFFHNGTYSEGGFMLHFPLSGRESCHCSG